MRIQPAVALCCAVLASHSMPASASAPRGPSANPEILIARCTRTAATAHPWRAKQIERAIIRYRLAMSYRNTTQEEFSLRERAKMRAAEIEAATNLEQTCNQQPPQASPSSLPLP